MFQIIATVCLMSGACHDVVIGETRTGDECMACAQQAAAEWLNEQTRPVAVAAIRCVDLSLPPPPPGQAI